MIYFLEKKNNQNPEKQLLKKIEETEYLIIDECGMLDFKLFIKLNRFLQIIRNNTNLFGNIKLILCGDFSQLCPVIIKKQKINNDENEKKNNDTQKKTVCKNFFQDLSKNKNFTQNNNLNNRKRKIEEEEFKNELNPHKKYNFDNENNLSKLKNSNFFIRFIDEKYKEFFEIDLKDDSIKYIFQTILFQECFNKDNIFVLKQNMRSKDDDLLIEILNEARFNSISEKNKNILLTCVDKELEFPSTLLLPTLEEVNKINLVELQKNENKSYIFPIKKKYYNCREHEVTNKMDIFIEKHNITENLCLKIGIPVILTSNININIGLINGSQGVIIDFLVDENKNEIYPIVKFFSSNSKTVIKNKTLSKTVFNNNNDSGDENSETDFLELEKNQNQIIFPQKPFISKKYIQISYIPLKLAYALTIHKSQSLTLDYVKISFNKVWEFGQAYTALSRAKNLKGLSIIPPFNEKCFYTYQEVEKFYEKYS